MFQILVLGFTDNAFGASCIRSLSNIFRLGMKLGLQSQVIL